MQRIYPVGIHQGGAARSLVHPAGHTSRWVYAFILLQIGCQLALLSESTGPFRVPVRVAAFGASLVLLIVVGGRGQRHPSNGAACWVLGIVGLSLFYPTTNVLAGIAQVAMYVAILAPLFWVPRIKIDLAALGRVILILWVFHTMSAGVGVMQVYFPGRLQPALSPIYAAMDEDYVSDLSITTARGERVLRPMGLTDTPGGAAMAGFYAVLFALGFFLLDERLWMRALCVLSMTIGTVALYLAQIRSVLIMAAICTLVFMGMMLWRGRIAKLGMLVVVVTVVVVGGFGWAVSLGGQSVKSRLSSLVDTRPSEVYYRSRGVFLEQTINELLPQYPFGAGLGRWGMMSSYFGSADSTVESIYVEIQWTGWLLDGGVPLILAYSAALLLALAGAWKIFRSPLRPEPGNLYGNLYIWGALLIAYNVSACALTFNYPIFMSQAGLEFWLLNACIFSAASRAGSALAASKRIPR